MNSCKRLLSSVTAVIMATSVLAGCSSKAASTTKVQKEIEIKFPSFWVGKDSKAKTMNDLITKFNTDNAGKIKVTVEEIADYNAYEDKMKTNVAADTVPDVFIIKTGTLAQNYFKSGRLMDFTSYLKDGWKDKFVTNAIESNSYQSKVMAIPYEYGVTPVLFNDALLKQAGVMEFPKNYTEFFAACDKLKAANIIPMSQMTGENAWTSMLWYSQLVVAIGGPDVYKNIEKDGLKDPAFVEAAKVLQKMYKYTTNDAIGAGAAVAAGHFLNARTAMLMNGPWFIGRIKKEGVNDMYSQVKVAPAPLYEGGKGKEGGYIGFVQSDLCAAVQKDKDKETAVVKFLKYLTEAENIKKLSAESGSMFVIKTDAPSNIEKLQGQMIEQTNKAPYLVPHFQLMVKPACGTEFPQVLASLGSAKITPEQFVQRLNDKQMQ